MLGRTLKLGARLLRRLPGPCELCGRVLSTEIGLCPDCVRSLPFPGPSCQGCGLVLTPGHASSTRCAACLVQPLPFAVCRAGFAYRSPVSELLTQFKFNARLEAGFALSSLLARQFNDYYRTRPKPRLLVPVPLHADRQRQRGFNQAHEIARVISQHSRIPTAGKLLFRNRATAPQTEQLSSSARQQNMRAAFTARHSRDLPADAHLALIDDVVTTMATVTAVSRCLRAIGVSRIDVWCLARAQR